MAGRIAPSKDLFFKQGPRCVLLLHAYSGSPNDVRMLARFLESKGYSVYAPLFAGHGTLEPLDILHCSIADWEENIHEALQFLKDQGYQQVAVFGLSMGGIFATRMLEWQDQTIIGGGLFCSPIFPAKVNIIENFLIYTEKVKKNSGISDESWQEQIEQYRMLVEKQLSAIQGFSAVTAENLSKISIPIFLAQAGKDEMIDSASVFDTVAALKEKRFVLQWYPDSGHVITVGSSRRQLEKDVLDFLSALPWDEISSL